MQTEQHDEVERKYDVGDECVVPELTGLPGVTTVAPALDLVQVATYFDTPDLRLLSAGVTLRRRVGGVDDGWHLKLPAQGDRRTEIRIPPDAADGVVPDELLARVRVHVRGLPVSPTAVLTTRRSVRRLLDSDGGVLAEMCDDRVRAETSSQTPTLEAWREWELELVAGPQALLEAAEPLLLGAGARPATVSSKLSRVLAERLPARADWRDRRELGDKPTTADLLGAYLAEHLRRLQLQDRLLREGDQEGIHQLRIAARRLRSVLATYAPVAEPGGTTRLRDELKWLGGVLGTARDAQVMQARLSDLLAEEAPDLVLGDAQARIDDELGARFRAGRRSGTEALDSERYFRLLDALEAFVTAPPLTPDAHTPARRGVPALVEADLERVRRRHRVVEEATDPVERTLALHEVRKAAKRLRYAAESVRPVFGKRADRLAARAESLQELLGEHQDTVVARRTLVEVAAAARDEDGSGFTLGRLHSREERRAEDLEREYPHVLAALPRKNLSRWLRG